MLGKNDRSSNARTSGVLVQYLRDLNTYLKEKNISKKAVTLAVAILVLAGLLGIRYKTEGAILPTSASAGGRELPIYCVQTDEPKIALTFDAAWAEGRLLDWMPFTASFLR